jgi:hypothetical protein
MRIELADGVRKLRSYCLEHHEPQSQFQGQTERFETNGENSVRQLKTTAPGDNSERDHETRASEWIDLGMREKEDHKLMVTEARILLVI